MDAQQRVGKIKATITTTEAGIEVDLKAQATLPQTKFFVMALIDELANMQGLNKADNWESLMHEYISRDMEKQ